MEFPPSEVVGAAIPRCMSTPSLVPSDRDRYIRFWDIVASPGLLRRVDKAIYSAEQQRLIALLRSYRQHAGLRQTQVAELLDVPQSFVSKYESGDRRLDLIELRQVCAALGVSLAQLVADLDATEPTAPPNA